MTELPRDDVHDEVSDADALEQAMEVDPGEVVAEPTQDPEVPEADAIEQAIEVPDEDRR